MFSAAKVVLFENYANFLDIFSKLIAKSMRFCLISLIASALHLLYQLFCTFEDSFADFAF